MVGTIIKSNNSPGIPKSSNIITTRSIATRTKTVINKNRLNTSSPKSPINTPKKALLEVKTLDTGMQTEDYVKRITCGTQTEHSSTDLKIIKELLSKEWISDDTLNSYLEILNNHLCKKSDRSFLIINPIIVQAVKCLNDCNFLLDPLKIKQYEIIVMPVNDSKQRSVADGGTHWSLLIMDRNSQSFYHIDSLNNSQNIADAQQIADKLSDYFGNRSGKANITTIQGPQQRNNYDCGVYVVCNTEVLLSQMLNNKSAPFNPHLVCSYTITEADLINKRSVLAYIINNKHNISTEALISLMVSQKVGSTINQNVKTNYSHQSIQQEKPVSENKINCLMKKQKRNKPDKQNKPVSKTHLNPQTIMIKNKFDILNEITNSEQRLSSAIGKNFKKLVPKSDGKIIKENHGKIIVKNRKYEAKEWPDVSVTLCSDSQGRYVAGELNALSAGRVKALGYVRPNTTLIGIMNSCKSEDKNPLIILGGTNDSLINNTEEIYQHLEDKLIKVSAHNPVFMTTIPMRKDKSVNHPVNKQLRLINNYIRELVERIRNVYLINLNSLQRHHFTKQGVHLNMMGKRKLTYKILNALYWWYSQFNEPVASNTNRLSDNSPNQRMISRGDMQGVMDHSIIMTPQTNLSSSPGSPFLGWTTPQKSSRADKKTFYSNFLAKNVMRSFQG